MDAIPLDEPALLDPPALEPLAGPRTAILLLIALAAMVYLGSAGWGKLSPAEQVIGAGAELMSHSGSWRVPGPYVEKDPILVPLPFWLTRLSHAALGVSDFSTRLPIALAATALVALIALIGEQLGGSVRGFHAALIFFLSLGGPRLPHDFPTTLLPAALLAGAIYCLARGFPTRRHRRDWFLGCGALALAASLAGGWIVAGWFVLAIAILAQLQRHDRARLRGLRLFAMLLVLTPIAIWFAFPRFIPQITPVEIPYPTRPGIALAVLILIFPWWLFLAQPALTAIRQLRHEWSLDWPIALPLAILLPAALLIFTFPTRLTAFLCAIGAALWLGQVWPLIPRRAILYTIPLAIPALCLLPPLQAAVPFLPSLVACTVATAFLTLAWWLEKTHRHPLALYAIAAAISPPAYLALTALR